MSALDVLLQEDRSFPPPADFAERALVADDAMYDEGRRDPDALWARLARDLTWMKPFTRVLDWTPPHAEWLAAAVQWVGTLLFNVNTWEALDDALTMQQLDVRVWVPDIVGSACFLIASVTALATVQRRWVAWEPRNADWRIGTLNLVGSIAFGVAAIAAFGRPATGDLVDDRLANTGTAWGALCFLAGAWLLIRQARGARSASPADAEAPPADA